MLQASARMFCVLPGVAELAASSVRQAHWMRTSDGLCKVCSTSPERTTTPQLLSVLQHIGINRNGPRRAFLRPRPGANRPYQEPAARPPAAKPAQGGGDASKFDAHNLHRYGISHRPRPPWAAPKVQTREQLSSRRWPGSAQGGWPKGSQAHLRCSESIEQRSSATLP